jgi:2-(1,2-epoxy-1,2-dihydrophenyl)acetyl-CoA isomerase
MTNTTTCPVSYTVEHGVAAVRLDRPAASNALDREMKVALLDAFTAAGSDSAVRVVTITAAGKNFCVGQDLAEHVEGLRADPAHAMDTVREHYNPIVLALNAIEVPVVVGINGACVGAGLGLALAGDIRLAGERTKFGTAFTGIGLASDSGLSATLTALLGPSRATGLFLLGGTFDAQQAHTWGLVHQVVSDDEVAEQTAAVGARIGAGPTAAFAAVKKLIGASASTALGDVLDREAAAQERLGRSTDHSTAVEAFLAKEKPVFVGH